MTTFQNANGDSVTLEAFIAGINAAMLAYDQEHYAAIVERGLNEKVKAMIGKKYIRIVKYRDNQENSGSAYCFLDMAGNIYKAASWAAPAKHIRGSVFDANYSWGKALGPYGAAYLR